MTAPTPGAPWHVGPTAPPEFGDFVRPAVALAKARRFVDVPVALPSNLRGVQALRQVPHGVTASGVRYAQLTLYMPNDALVTIQFGHAGFDGCAFPNLRSADVTGMPALTTFRKPLTAAVIWPAGDATRGGVYGVSGLASRKTVLDFARAMNLSAMMPTEPSSGC